MKVKEQLDTILHKEMDRKNFLQYSGGILLGVLGITGLLRVILSGERSQILKTTSSEKTGGGYGSSRYGR